MIIHTKEGIRRGYSPISVEYSRHWNKLLQQYSIQTGTFNIETIFMNIIDLFPRFITYKQAQDKKNVGEDNVFYDRIGDKNNYFFYKQITLNNLYGWMKYMIGNAGILTQIDITYRKKGTVETGFVEYFDWLVAPIFYKLVALLYEYPDQVLSAAQELQTEAEENAHTPELVLEARKAYSNLDIAKQALPYAAQLAQLAQSLTKITEMTGQQYIKN